MAHNNELWTFSVVALSLTKFRHLQWSHTMDEDTPETDGQSVRFAVAIATDRDQFLRLTCSECGRDFKTEVDPGDFQWALASQCRRMGLEVGGEDGDLGPPRIRCPYCGHEDSKAEMQTAETVEYLKRILYREYVLPQVNQMFSGLEDSIGGGDSSGGIFSFSLEFKHNRQVLPVRPLHGPEPADMKIIDFTCCQRKMKVSEGWGGVDLCCFCGETVALT